MTEITKDSSKKNIGPNSSRFYGPAFVVAGSAIGAGMLGLPMAVASLGLIWGSILLIALWAIMYYGGLIMLDISAYHGTSASVGKLGNIYVNKFVGGLAGLMLMLMLSALLVAYMDGGTSLIMELFKTYGGVNFNKHLTMAIFISVMTLLICIDIKILDKGNRLFFSAKILVFVVVMSLILSKVNFNVVSFGVQGAGLSPWTVAIPLFFTSFGFHGGIPTIINYAQHDWLMLRRIFFWGTFIPLLVYLLWVIGGLGILYTQNSQALPAIINGSADVGQFIVSLGAATQQPWLKSIISLIALLGILTSFLGVGVGLFDYYREGLENLRFISSKQLKIYAAVLAFVVPAIITVVAGKSFVSVLCVAGVFLSMIALVIPCIIWLKIKQTDNLKFKPNLKIFLIYLLLAIGTFVIVCQAYNLSS